MEDQEDVNPYIIDACLRMKRKVKEICEYCEALIVVVNSKIPKDATMRLVCVQGASVILSGFNDRKLTDRVIEKSSPYWTHITERDETFFKEKAQSVFGELPINFDIFADFFKDGVLTTNQKNKLWTLFEGLIPISCLYIHEMRSPVKMESPDGNGKMIGTYKKAYLNHLKLKQYVDKYNVKLRVFHS